MTRQRASSFGLVVSGPSVENIRRLMHQRNAASVLPVPVGAKINEESPREIAGQPRIWGRVGPVKTAKNQSRTAGWKRSRVFAGSVSAGAEACVTVESSDDFLRLRLDTLNRFLVSSVRCAES